MLPLATLALSGCGMDVLHPQGPVGNREVSLLVISSLAMLIVVIPAIFLTVLFAWRYRASRNNPDYDPNFKYSRKIDLTVWLVPLAIVCFLTVLDWRSTVALDPYQPLPGKAPVLHVQVISLDWKWLFIYPDQHIAAVNQLEFPAGTQVDFSITSDTVMNVFFIPQLGSQIYSMAGMVTKLHLLAKNPGTYRGLSANFSGAGFPGMHFQAKAVDAQQFAAWVTHAQASPTVLNMKNFQYLAGPSANDPVSYYGNVTPGLFNRLVTAHAGPGPSASPRAME